MYSPCVIVTATQLAKSSASVLDQVINGGETVEVQRHRRTVAGIRPRVGVNRSELIRLLRGRNFTEAGSRQLRQAMADAADVIGHADGN